MQITVSQKIVGISAQWLDKNNNPAPVDGAVTWSWDTPDAQVVDAGDGTVELVPADSVAGPVVGTLTATADADLGEGNTPVVATAVVTIVPEQAVSGAINLGTVVDK